MVVIKYFHTSGSGILYSEKQIDGNEKTKRMRTKNDKEITELIFIISIPFNE